ncbi:hypothetical protein [Sinomicrobium weinanense]|uniref:Uncharacterized protein n=1 Tax=Sinomicrobium weinanense TaxID=2842200 RepID=A0A926JRD0_9FLAO|nr:hypothetical protein [Sinomicrobium weinanense]MBC9795899.1 hypothetical protein [Sinomicrobium weinanense]MBU3124722.1 hypothetical protein [Sinomicrobium weinanense]
MEKWIQNLMESVFGKVKEIAVETSVNGRSRYLAQKMEDDFSFRLSDRNITRYYKAYITGEKRKITPNKATLNALAEFIGYRGFEDFIRRNETKEEEKCRKFSRQIKKMYKQIALSLVVNFLLLSGLFFFVSKYYKKNCMIWMDDHYEKIRCSDLELEVELNEKVLAKFKKNTGG